MRVNRLLSLLPTIALLLLFPLSSFAAQEKVSAAKKDLPLRVEIEKAIGKGLTWLSGKQAPDGSWSQPEHPAPTGLVLLAFQGDPTGLYKRKYSAGIAKGYGYLLRNVQPDGGIYGKDLTNFNTSISMMALLAANRPEYEPIIRKARAFEVSLQETRESSDPMNGGIGYGGALKHSDLTNTSSALEALYYTRYLKSDVANDPDTKDLNWKAAAQFISRSQNLPGSNDQTWASDDPRNKGGFIYFPGDSKAGELELPNGKVALSSSGSLSYSGLMSLIYAQVDKNDPRVVAVIDWLSKNYSLDENPGVGQAGLYYYYHVMAKALSAAGVDTLTLKDGKKINWRRDLATRLLKLQKADGSWVNTNGRWWEKDSQLVTSYATITLETVLRGLD